MELLALLIGQCGDGLFIKRGTFLLFYIAGSQRGQILAPSRQECRHHLPIFHIHVQPKLHQDATAALGASSMHKEKERDGSAGGGAHLLRNKGIAKIAHVLRQPPSMRAKDGTVQPAHPSSMGRRTQQRRTTTVHSNQSMFLSNVLIFPIKKLKNEKEKNNKARRRRRR